MLDQLIRLIEAGPGRALSLRALEAAPGGDHLSDLRVFDAVRPGQPLSEILCPWCEVQRVRPRFRAGGHYVATCFECGEVAVAAEKLETVQADFDWFFHVLARAFDGVDRASLTVLVPELLWSLGECAHEGTKIEVLFARLPGDTKSEERVARALDDRPKGRCVLALTSRTSPLRHLSRSGERVVVSLPDVATLEEDGLQLDACLLDLVVGPRASPVAPIEIAPDGSWLRLGGRELRLSGKQRDFALVMVDAWRSGNRQPKLEWVLRRAGYGEGTSELRHVTKRPDFFEFFGYGNGEVWILIGRPT